MPDRDKVPRGIPRRYKTVYKQLCEQQEPAAIAHFAMSRLKGDVRKHGGAARKVISQVSSQLELLGHNSLLRQIPESYDEAHEVIDTIVRGVVGHPDYTEWAADACHQITMRLEQGGAISDVQHELLKQFYLNVWHGRFVERVPLHVSHHVGAEPVIVQDQLQRVTEELEKEVGLYVAGEEPLAETNLLEINIMGGKF